jgi:hypothetical protein
MRTDKLAYQDVAEWFTKARNPDAGRPVQSWARMFKVENTEGGYNYELRFGSYTVGIFTPDNKFTFTLTAQGARNCSVTLSQALQRAIPFLWYRVGSGRYVVKPTPSWEAFKQANPNHNSYAWQYFKTQKGYEVFNGLCFDLNTYEPVNARPDHKDKPVNQDNKLTWLRMLRKFKQAAKVRARMGVVDTLIAQVERERGGSSRYDWRMPDWNSDEWQNILYTSIKNNDCSTDLLKGVIQSASRGYYRSSIGSSEVMKEIDRLCTTYSIDLRRKFGVYDEVSNLQEQNEVSRHAVASGG